MLKNFAIVFTLFAIASSVAGTSLRQSPFGLVGGITDCGSNGRLGDVFVTDCTQTPCHFVPGTNYDIAVRFFSSTTSSNLFLHVYNADFTTKLIEIGIPGEIEKDTEYELKFVLPITDAFAGTAFNIRFYILDVQNQRNEICAQAAVTIGW